MHVLPVDEKEAAAQRHRIHLQALKGDHKTAMRTLRSNKYFVEFLRKANESNKKAQGASYNRVEASDQMEATTSDTIRLAGEKAGRPMHGVWSVFGKPYAPMGLPTTVQHKLPALNRDDINGVVKTPESSGRKKGSRGRAQGRGGAAVATPNTPMPVSAAARGQDGRAEKPKTPVGGKLSLGEEALLCWAVSDEEEVRFPRDTVQLATYRARKAFSGRPFVSAKQADHELAYFAEPIPEGEEEEGAEVGQQLMEGAGRADGQDESSSSPPIGSSAHTHGDGGTPSATMPSEFDELLDADAEHLTEQEAGATRAGAVASASASVGQGMSAREMFVGGGERGGTGRPFSSRSAMMARTRVAAANPPLVKPPTVPKPCALPGYMYGVASFGGSSEFQSESPVVRWRKEFLDVRHSKNQQLFDQLQDRAARRATAMRSTQYTAAVCTQLLQDMRLRGGRVSSLPIPSRNDSWARAHVAMHAKDQPRKVDVAEIQAIERFYEKLCHLVERQRVTDPFSLSLVHKVKSLLEQGINMNRALLLRVMEHVREIYELGSFDNPYVMTILHFIRQSTRVSAEEFDHLMRQHGMAGLLGAPATIARGTAPKGSTPTSGRRPAAAAARVEAAEAAEAAEADEAPMEEGADVAAGTAEAAAEGIDQGITTVGEAAAVV